MSCPRWPNGLPPEPNRTTRQTTLTIWRLSEMKVMVRKVNDQYTVYVPKKDLETAIVKMEKPTLWGGLVTLENGWVLELPDLPPETRLPITVEAKKLADT